MNDLDNTLVHQKDAVLIILNGEGDIAQRMELALERLDTLQELWCKSTYHYKGREIAGRIRHECWEMLGDTRNWKRKERLKRISARAAALEDKFWAAECGWKRTPICV